MVSLFSISIVSCDDRDHVIDLDVMTQTISTMRLASVGVRIDRILVLGLRLRNDPEAVAS